MRKRGWLKKTGRVEKKGWLREVEKIKKVVEKNAENAPAWSNLLDFSSTRAVEKSVCGSKKGKKGRIERTCVESELH